MDGKNEINMKTVFVTGASRGIGLEIAREMTKLGNKVAFGYLKNTKFIQEDINELKIQNPNIIPVQIDLGSRESIHKAKILIENKLGSVDILINNGAIAQEKDFLEITDQDFDNMLSVNLRGPFICIQEFLPNMLRNKWGRIINISSIGGQWGGINQLHYAASKAALINLTRSISKLYSSKGVICNAISIGLVETDMTKNEIKTNLGLEKIKSIPCGRIGTVKDVSNVVNFLSSNNSNYISGQTINVNGGMFFS